jgi:serine/threonine protein kinase
LFVIELGEHPVPGYRLGNRLGRGGFGEVWEGFGPDGSRVALKFLDCKHKSSSLVSNEIRQLLMIRELRHPHLIQLHNVYAASNYIVLSMEVAEGTLGDLHLEYREQEGTHLPPDLLCDLLGQAASALDFLGAQRVRSSFYQTGLQHCDVKPTNLLLFGNCLKVSDFGLCVPQVEGGRRKFIGGTPPYAAPELYDGRLTERTDQYALAITYCELRCGEWPYPKLKGRRSQGPSGLRLMRQGAKAQGPPDLHLIPKAEQPILARALEPQWINRWPSCGAMMNALREVVKGAGTPAPTLPCTVPNRVGSTG